MKTKTKNLPMIINVNSTAVKLLSPSPFRPCPNASCSKATSLLPVLCHNATRFSLCPITNASASVRMFSLCPITRRFSLCSITNVRRFSLCSITNARRLLLCPNASARMFLLPQKFLIVANAMRVHTGTNCFFLNPKPYNHKENSDTGSEDAAILRVDSDTEVDLNVDSDTDTDTEIKLYTDSSPPSIIPCSLLYSIDKNIINKSLSRSFNEKQRSSKRFLYVQSICKLLEETKHGIKLYPENKDNILRDLQLSIEKSTVLFDEKSIYKTSIDLFDKLTSDPVTLEKRSSNMRNILIERLKDEYIRTFLNGLNVYTVEVLVIYALGQIFNDFEKNNPIVKATTLVDKLGQIVLKEHSAEAPVYTLDSNIEDPEPNIEDVINIDKKCIKLGREILNILFSKGLLAFVDYPIDKGLVSIPWKKPLYVRCLYDFNLVPIKFNLPMVVPPIPWHVEKKENDKTGKTVNTVLRGGYLTDSADIYYRYRLISSKNPELFKLRMTVRSEKDYLPVISLLQSVGFRIDDTVIEFLTKNMKKLIENRLLSDEDFIGVNPDSFVSELKNSIDINYGSLLKEIIKESQKARNEQNVLLIAKAYSGYDLYFPAFQDFRGRVYRTGIFNLHECDLYRSLLVFKTDKPIRKLSLSEIPLAIKTATAKRYKSSLNSDKESIKWFDKWYSNLQDKNIDDYVIESMKSAKDPFQFMRKALLTLKGGCFEAEPVFMDASSSAYQIMGYLLQDTKIASQTNLINGLTREDLYTNLREDYIKYLRDSNHIIPRLEPFFTRKLIKKIFMPITYGKTVKAIADDLYEVLWKQISYKSCMILGKESFKFWCLHYRELHNLLKLFGGIGYLCSSLGRAVKLSTPLFYSYQDYRKFEKQSVWVYSNKKSKDKRTRHKLSFNVLTTKRNVLKSKCATFANFIHQKDALVAINTICSIYKTYGEIPIYTVHDCFVSNHAMSEKMADIYKETLFNSLGNPMELINEFLFKNLIAPNYPNYMSSDYTDDRLDFMIQNPINSVSHCLSKSDPIPVEHLMVFMKKWIDVKVKSLGVTKTKTFEERANEVIECYNNYVRSQCNRVIDRVYGNTDFAKELVDQRNAIKNRMFQFRDICFNKPGKNYSLT